MDLAFVAQGLLNHSEGGGAPLRGASPGNRGRWAAFAAGGEGRAPPRGVQRGLAARILDAPHEMQILLMLGVALVLENVALSIFGPDPRRIRSPLALSTIWLGPVFVDVARLVTP